MPPLNTVITPAKIVPLTRSNFVLDWGQGAMGFAEIVLPVCRAEVLSYREGDEKQGTDRKIPGRITYGPTLLRRGTTPSKDFVIWWKSVQDGQPVRRDIKISILDDQKNVVKRFALIQAWPTRFQPGPLNATGDDIFMEELELACERVDLDATF